MSGSDLPGTLRVIAPGANIQVLDADLRPVPDAIGVGAVEAALPPGAYSVVGDLEGTSVSRDILVRPGSANTLELEVHLAPAAPVYRLPTANETHGILAHELSAPKPPRGRAALVIVLRGLATRAMAPLDQSPTITDWDGTPVTVPPPSFDPHHRPGDRPRAVGWRMDLEPGAYRVRWEGPGVQPVEHSVWAARDHKTLIFVPQGPTGPGVTGMSLHILARGQAYEDVGLQTESVELALSVLRSSTATRTMDSLTELLGAKAPLAAQLFAAAALVKHRDETSDRRTASKLATTIRRLHDALGDMPDVLALGGAVPASEVFGSLDVPPMLSASMDLLLAADREDPEMIPAGSAVETVSGERYVCRPWLLWKPLELEAWVAARSMRERWAVEPVLYRPKQEGDAYRPEQQGDAGGSGEFDAVVLGATLRLDGHVLASLRPEPVSPTVKGRVKAAVEEVAPRLEVSNSEAAKALGADELAQRLEIPQTLVERALQSLYG